MTRKEIIEMMETLKHQTTKTLTDARDGLDTLEDERQLTKRMYFWHDFGNASERRRFCARYDCVEIYRLSPHLSIKYRRDVNPSRSYAYASDYIRLLVDGEYDRDLTISDVKKLIKAINELLDKREKKTAKKKDAED